MALFSVIFFLFLSKENIFLFQLLLLRQIYLQIIFYSLIFDYNCSYCCIHDSQYYIIITIIMILFYLELIEIPNSNLIYVLEIKVLVYSMILFFIFIFVGIVMIKSDHTYLLTSQCNNITPIDVTVFSRKSSQMIQYTLLNNKSSVLIIRRFLYFIFIYFACNRLNKLITECICINI